MLCGKCTCPKELPYCVCNYKSLGKIINKKPIVAKEEERAGGLDMIYELMRMLGCEKTETVRDSYLSMLEKRGV